jgi:hypothetical protein
MADEGKTGLDTYHVTKLTEDNYTSWCQLLTWILNAKELLNLAEGREKAPKPLELESLINDSIRVQPKATKIEYETKLAK